MQYLRPRKKKHTVYIFTQRLYLSSDRERKRERKVIFSKGSCSTHHVLYVDIMGTIAEFLDVATEGVEFRAEVKWVVWSPTQLGHLRAIRRATLGTSRIKLMKTALDDPGIAASNT